MTTTDRDINERLDHLGIVAGVCQEIGLAAPTGYATSERRGGESPENLAKTAEMWLPERKLYLCRFGRGGSKGSPMVQSHSAGRRKGVRESPLKNRPRRHIPCWAQ